MIWRTIYFPPNQFLQREGQIGNIIKLVHTNHLKGTAESFSLFARKDQLYDTMIKPFLFSFSMRNLALYYSCHISSTATLVCIKWEHDCGRREKKPQKRQTWVNDGNIMYSMDIKGYEEEESKTESKSTELVYDAAFQKHSSVFIFLFVINFNALDVVPNIYPVNCSYLMLLDAE